MSNYDRWKTRSPDDDRPPDEFDDRPDEDLGEQVIAAARLLIGVVRGAERSERARSAHGELELGLQLTDGGIETWKITIERTASSH